MKATRVLLATAALLAMGLSSIGGLAPTANAHHEGNAMLLAAGPETGRTYVLTVEGMSCPTGCAPKVEEALRTIEGVESVEVDFANRKAVVRTAAGHEVTQKACDTALGNSGYFVDAIEEIAGDDSGA